MESSKFVSEWEREQELRNAQVQASNGQPVLRKVGDFLRDVSSGIDNYYSLQNQNSGVPANTNQNLPANMATGRNNTLLWILGGIIFIGGVAWIVKRSS